MRIADLCAASLGSLLIAATAHAAPVEVAFIEPDRYTDATPNARIASEAERQHVFTQLRAHLVELGARHLRADDHLVIEVLDIDLAGRFEPFRRTADDVRFMRDITWPRINVRYTLQRAGQQTAGEARIADMNYLMNAHRCRSAEALCFEKRMLSDWFERRFAADAVAARH